MCDVQLEDCALQLYRVNGAQGDYGSYLDLDLSLDEQWEEFEGFSEGYVKVKDLNLCNYYWFK